MFQFFKFQIIPSIILFWLCKFEPILCTTKVIPALVRNVVLLHPLKDIKDPDFRNFTWPVLFIQLDIGNVCLQSEGYQESMGFFYKFSHGRDPECNQLHCGGPPGPVQTWTNRALLKALSDCVSHGFDEEDDDIDYSTLPTGRQIFGASMSPPTTPLELSLSDPEERLGSILTPEEIMAIHITSKTKGFEQIPVLVVDTHSLHYGLVTFCMFNNEVASTSPPTVEGMPGWDRLRKKCTFLCQGNGGGDPWDWREEELLESMWTCLGRAIIHGKNEITNFYIERDHVLGKVVIQTANTRADTRDYFEDGNKEETHNDSYVREMRHIEL